MLPLISIYTGGALSLLMALLHMGFYKKFGWKVDLRRVSVLNRRILYTIHWALILMFIMMALLSLVYARELSAGRGAALGFNGFYCMFWMWRLVWQWAYLKDQNSHPIAILFNVLFALLFLSYLIPLLYRI